MCVCGGGGRQHQLKVKVLLGYSTLPLITDYSKYVELSLSTKPYFLSKLNFDAIPGKIVIGAV